MQPGDPESLNAVDTDKAASKHNVSIGRWCHGINLSIHTESRMPGSIVVQNGHGEIRTCSDFEVRSIRKNDSEVPIIPGQRIIEQSKADGVRCLTGSKGY